MAAVPSAAQVGSGRIAYATDGTGIYTVAADGGDRVTLKSENARVPRWSPDGSKIAFVDYFEGDHGLAAHLKVMNADGTDEHIVASADWWQDIWLGNQPWSPDGSRIAWGPDQSAPGADIYTASSAGGEIRRITTDGRRKEPPVWSPAGQQLAYTSSVPGSELWELFLARDDGSAPVQITQGFQPSWSPNGASIAFLGRAGYSPAIYVVHPDGTDLHRVVTFPSGEPGRPAWSPDGSKIAYTTSFLNPGKLPPGQEILVANADGSGARQLTNLDSQGAYDAAPTWSPDGDRMLFRRAPNGIGALWTVNPDGTCQGLLAAVASTELPSWQPVPGGPPIGRKMCPAALAVEGTRTPNGDGSAITIHGTITNPGTQPTTNVALTISAPGHDLGFDLSGDGCTRQTEGVVCQVARLGAGESRAAAALGMVRRIGLDESSRAVPLQARLDVTADGALNATYDLFFTPSRCTTLDPGGGRIDGTGAADHICGRRGADRIHPGYGKDYVTAGAGPDVIYARDGYGDLLTCGRGRDLVIADRTDKVSRSCERVRRGRYR
jgi:Tol biopolymer transport system component